MRSEGRRTVAQAIQDPVESKLPRDGAKGQHHRHGQEGVFSQLGAGWGQIGREEVGNVGDKLVQTVRKLPPVWPAAHRHFQQLAQVPQLSQEKSGAPGVGLEVGATHRNQAVQLLLQVRSQLRGQHRRLHFRGVLLAREAADSAANGSLGQGLGRHHLHRDHLRLFANEVGGVQAPGSGCPCFTCRVVLHSSHHRDKLQRQGHPPGTAGGALHQEPGADGNISWHMQHP
mmetsp:Transcript_87008/g.137997  ORF Transcript_87008/g.137997 Transcript_87008/m.137997 type:complete len:229 (+) Transcript_87008:1626-2312(+)